MYRITSFPNYFHKMHKSRCQRWYDAKCMKTQVFVGRQIFPWCFCRESNSLVLLWVLQSLAKTWSEITTPSIATSSSWSQHQILFKYENVCFSKTRPDPSVIINKKIGPVWWSNELDGAKISPDDPFFTWVNIFF